MTATIDAHEISGVFWWPQNLTPAKFLEYFELFFNFLILFFFYQNQTVLNCSWTRQSNCLFVLLFLKKNWICLFETLLGPIRHFFDGQKRQKRQRDFGLGYILAIFVCQYFMLLYFLRIIQYFFMKFCSCSWYNIGGQYTQTMAPVSLGPFLWFFGVLFWHMYLLFFMYVQYFVMKFCAVVLDITLIITNTFSDIMSPSSRGHFRVFWGLFWHITSTFWEPFYMFSWNFVQTYLVFLLRVTALCFFHIMTHLWSLRVGGGKYFGAHFGQCPSNTS